MRVLPGWGQRWPTVGPSEASVQVCSGLSIHQASWGRGCPSAGSPRGQPKPGQLRCQRHGAAPCPPSSEKRPLDPLPVAGMVQNHKSCGPPQAGSPTVGPSGGRRRCLVSLPAPRRHRQGQDPVVTQPGRCHGTCEGLPHAVAGREPAGEAGRRPERCLGTALWRRLPLLRPPHP